MKITVANDIKDILFEKNTVAIPGFGALKSEYKSAVVDGVTGKLTPPALDIQFDPNLTIDDGALVDFLKSKYNITTQDAQDAIEQFMQNANAIFDNHEIMSVPDVGRFYKDFSQTIRFLPEKTNFNLESFGLPTLQYYPVSRTRVEVETAIEKMNEPHTITLTTPTHNQALPQSIETVDPPSVISEQYGSDNGGFNWRSLVPLAAVGMVALLAIMIFNFSQKKENTEGSALDKMNVNTKPNKAEIKDINAATTPPVANPPVSNVKKETPPTVANDNMIKDDKSGAGSSVIGSGLTPQEGEKAVIIIGGFANKSNIKRLKDWIAKNKFGIYERKSGGMMVIGAEVIYKDKKELNEQLMRFRARYGDEVEIMQ